MLELLRRKSAANEAPSPSEAASTATAPASTCTLRGEWLACLHVCLLVESWHARLSAGGRLQPACNRRAKLSRMSCVPAGLQLSGPRRQQTSKCSVQPPPLVPPLPLAPHLPRLLGWARRAGISSRWARGTRSRRSRRSSSKSSNGNCLAASAGRGSSSSGRRRMRGTIEAFMAATRRLVGGGRLLAGRQSAVGCWRLIAGGV